ncbi:assembly protein [Salmonella enterica subsp. enterica serovar Rubislaw]|nr:assembly protein [Salmonella enterica subsp. enterica serovar Rubislaw]
MTVYVVTGKLGSGKTLVTVAKIQDAIVEGRPVATNLNLNLHNMPQVGRMAKSPRVIRLPDKPQLSDLEAIGKGNLSYDESRNGLIVLDECGTWFNARTWADKSRQAVINWCLHARKLGWDIIFIIQDLSLIDKQVRLSMAEYVVYCRRFDRITVPFLGLIWKLLTGSRLLLPQVHFGLVKYGDTSTSLVADRWMYRGRGLYAAYDTRQIFSDNYALPAFGMLPPYITHGQFSVKHGGAFYMRLTRIYFKRLSKFRLLFTGVMAGMALFWLAVDKPHYIFTSDAAVAPAPAAALPVSDFRITSSSFYGTEVNYTFTDAHHQTYSSADVIKNGYHIFYIDACSVVIERGGKREKVSC